jgi:hypothetical protein
MKSKRHFVLVLLALVIAGSCAYGAVWVFGSHGNGGTHAALRAGVFAGEWHVHTTGLLVDSDGRGVATWPIHAGCSSGETGLPLCDRAVLVTEVGPNGHVRHLAEVIEGGHADVVLTWVSSNIARGRIEDSTDASTLPDGDATFRVSKSDLLYVTVSRPTTASPFVTGPLCGTKAAALTLDQQVARGINCGA